MTDAPQRIAVIGAGIVGSAVARQLALLGARVWLVDRADRAEATTRISFAWLNAHRKREPNYHRLNVAGMTEHHVLAQQLDPCRRWHFPTGHLEYATEPDHAARIEQDIAELRELDYPAQRVDREWAQAREPWVRIPEGTRLDHVPLAAAACGIEWEYPVGLPNPVRDVLTVIGRFAEPAEIAAAAFLLSDESTFFCGSELLADGGYSLR